MYRTISVTYSQVENPNSPSRAPDGWFLTVAISQVNIHVFKLEGKPPAFRYSYKHIQDTSFVRSPEIRGGYEIGRIKEENIPRLETTLAKIHHKHLHDDFDDKKWVIEAIEVLRTEKGAKGDESLAEINEGVCYNDIRDKLLEDVAKWETADSYYDRTL